MKNELENKIEQTLNSLNGIQQAEANPYLFEKIKLKLNAPEEIAFGFRWSLLATCIVVVALNVAAVYSNLTGNTASQPKEEMYKTLGNELGLNNDYNY